MEERIFDYWVVLVSDRACGYDRESGWRRGVL